MQKLRLNSGSDLYEVRLPDLGMFEHIARQNPDDWEEPIVRELLQTVRGEPWPPPKEDRRTAALDIPMPVYLRLVEAVSEHMAYPKDVADAALKGASYSDYGGTITILGDVYEVATPTVRKHRERMQLCGKRTVEATILLLRDHIRSFNGAPVEKPHVTWPFDLPTTRLLMDFLQVLMAGGLGNAPPVVLVDE